MWVGVKRKWEMCMWVSVMVGGSSWKVQVEVNKQTNKQTRSANAEKHRPRKRKTNSSNQRSYRSADSEKVYPMTLRSSMTLAQSGVLSLRC